MGDSGALAVIAKPLKALIIRKATLILSVRPLQAAVSSMQEEKLMVRPSPDVATIVQALKTRGATVDGPTERDGELVYRINEHNLTEHEIRSLADSGRLTTWEIYNYARNRALS